ncbi:hypothetical protein HanIR_Chr08g0350861 [Helianthus annuus]|nr:hypothetical protein HanIR_Chr08g0350861 [Helianthus annuus]
MFRLSSAAFVKSLFISARHARISTFFGTLLFHLTTYGGGTCILIIPSLTLLIVKLPPSKTHDHVSSLFDNRDCPSNALSCWSSLILAPFTNLFSSPNPTKPHVR